VFPVLADRTGAVLAVTVSGETSRRSVNVFDGVRFHALAPRVFADHPAWGQQQILFQSLTGEWWAATKVGLCRFPPLKAADLAWTQPETCYAPDTEVFRVLEDSKGRMWASARCARDDELMRLDPSTGAFSSEKADGLASAFAEDRNGAIWMGIWGGGLLRYDGRQFTPFDPRAWSAGRYHFRPVRR
jgi:ligand-binding sensor domain-containing protein